MSNSLVSFGAGLAVGSLVTGILKAVALGAIAAGVGLAAYKLFPWDKKESTECKSGPKQN